MAEIKIIQKFDTYWEITVDGNRKLAIATGHTQPGFWRFRYE
jgi:hypothetical protein